MPAWDDYQEKVAEFFRSLRLEAETNISLQGARTSHDIDVIVRTSHVGFDLLWLVECKHWRRRISKLHVLGLRAIVSDVGADRGIIMAETGFQRGAIEAAQLTNVQLTSLVDLARTAGRALDMAEVATLQERVDRCHERYWDLDKDTRIHYGLRSEVGLHGYSGRRVINIVNAALALAFRGSLPLTSSNGAVNVSDSPELLHYLMLSEVSLETPRELIDHFESWISDLENRLDAAEAVIERDAEGS